MGIRTNSFRVVLAAITAGVLPAQTIELVAVVSKQVQREVKLPGELQPYQTVEVRARVAGFIDKVLVDRGSVVKKGDVLVELVAPEMQAQLAELESKAQAAVSQRAEAEARLAAAEATYNRLKEASATPGAIAGNELIQAEKAVDAARAVVRTAGDSIKAARSSVQAQRDLEAYLKVTAPFHGVITDRYVHPGALAGPNTGALLKLDQDSELRLVVAVPEAVVGGIERGARVSFRVPAYPGESFQGRVSRLSHSVDMKTRTMPVELDVENGNGRLAPGMYPEVTWPIRRPHASLLVPPGSIVTTTERSFVIRSQDGRAEWVNVARGAPAGDLVEVFGALKPGDEIVKRGTDEIREGSKLR